MKINSIVGINLNSGIGVNIGNIPYEQKKPVSNNNYMFLPASNVNFGMRIDYGVPAKLAEPLQEKVLNIHKNLDFIQNFFLRFTVKNPQLGAKIKKEYPDVVPKRQSGIVFKLPDTENTIEVMRSQTRDNIVYISINDGKPDYNGIVIDGKDKLIANYLSRHPHMLPRGIKHMNAERMAEAEPEKFINIADEKLQNYSDFIKKVDSGEIKVTLGNNIKNDATAKPKGKTLPPKKKTIVKSQTDSTTSMPEQVKVIPEKQSSKTINRVTEPKSKSQRKPPRLTNADFEKLMADKSKGVVKQISTLLSKDVKDFPPHLKPKIAPSGKPIGFVLDADDGGKIIVTRKAVGSYGNSMPYLSFEKINKDNSLNFISIDMITNRVLRTKDKGKPYISSDHNVFELTPDELKKRKIDEKLDYYMSQIFKGVNSGVNDNKIAPVQKVIEEVKPVENPTNARVADDLNDIDQLKLTMRELGKRDGKIAATEYFNAFKEQFLNDIAEKMSELHKNIQDFIKKSTT